METNNLINAGKNLLNNVTNNDGIVKDVYSDAVKPAAQEMGKALAEPVKGISRIGRLINAICSPIDIWILNKEHSVKETAKLLEKKLEKIPDEEIVTPPNYVFVPALQAISVSIDNEVLRDMYANLLAKSVYAKTSAQAHPAHVDIIRQMDPIDAIIFKSFSEHQFSLPIKEFSIVNKSNDLVLHSNVYLTDYDLYDVHTISVSLDNLIRLGLLFKMDNQLFDESLYDNIDKNPKVVEFCNKEIAKLITDTVNQSAIYENKVLGLTTFGISFYNTCCKDINMNH